MDGVVDLGIIGENVLEEELLSRRAQGEDPRYFTLRRLDFGGCRLSLATPLDAEYTGPQSLQDARIATSYPHLLKQYLDKQGVRFKSCLLNGSVEVAPRRPADAICDLVSTGATLEANGLREVEVIYRSKACLIQRDGEMPEAKQQLIDRLMTRIQGVIQRVNPNTSCCTRRARSWTRSSRCCRAPNARPFCRWPARRTAWRCTWSAAKPCSGKPWKN